MQELQDLDLFAQLAQVQTQPLVHDLCSARKLCTLIEMTAQENLKNARLIYVDFEITDSELLTINLTEVMPERQSSGSLKMATPLRRSSRLNKALTNETSNEVRCSADLPNIVFYCQFFCLEFTARLINHDRWWRLPVPRLCRLREKALRLPVKSKTLRVKAG